MNEPTWNEQYSARFKVLSSRDVEVWEEIIFQTIRNTRPGEVLKAVITLGEDKQNGKYEKYAPTVENLMSAMKKNRWLSSPRRDGPQQSGCALCQGNGWMPFGACVTNHETFVGEQVMSIGAGRHHSDKWPYYIFSTPCLCTLGERQLNAYRPEERGKIMELTKRAFEFKKTITADSPGEDQLCSVDEG